MVEEVLNYNLVVIGFITLAVFTAIGLEIYADLKNKKDL